MRQPERKMFENSTTHHCTNITAALVFPQAVTLPIPSTPKAAPHK